MKNILKKLYTSEHPDFVFDLKNYDKTVDCTMSFLPIKQKGMPRIADVLTVVSFCALILGFTLWFAFASDKEFSPDENRYLQTSPELSFETLTEGKFMVDITKYYSDQFPMREKFIEMKVGAETLLQRNGNKSVLFGKDGYLFQRFDVYDDVTGDLDDSFTYDEQIELLTGNVTGVTKLAGAIDIPVIFAAAPRKIDVMASKLPALYPSNRADKLYEMTYDIQKQFEGETAKLMNITGGMLTKLREHDGEYIFFKTDHHWTMRGAWYATRFAMVAANANRERTDVLTETFMAEDNYTKQTISEGFYGTTWSKSGAYWFKPDTMELWTDDRANTASNRKYVTEIEKKATFDGLIDTAALEKKDKYAAYIGGINPVTHIYTADADDTSPSFEKYKGQREHMLFVCDSYGQTVAPFLAAVYDVTIIDLRFYNKSVKKYIEDNDIDIAFVLQNMESLTTANNMVNLGLGLE